MTRIPGYVVGISMVIVAKNLPKDLVLSSYEWRKVYCFNEPRESEVGVKNPPSKGFLPTKARRCFLAKMKLPINALSQINWAKIHCRHVEHDNFNVLPNTLPATKSGFAPENFNGLKTIHFFLKQKAYFQSLCC